MTLLPMELEKIIEERNENYHSSVMVVFPGK